MSETPGPPLCPACGRAGAVEPGVLVEEVPILLNLRTTELEEARSAPRGTLTLRACDGCGLIWNAAFAGVPYDARYHVDQSRSPRFAAHLDEIAARCLSAVEWPSAEGAASGGPLSLVEIGCGQGLFLSRLAARLGSRLGAAHGFDPAFRAEGAALPERVRITAATFEEGAPSMGPVRPDLVVARHILEHVPDPVAFLAGIRRVLGDNPFTLVVETPDAQWTLERGLLHDACYEHCTLLTAEALGLVFARAGFPDVRIDRVFGGEYLLATARASSSPAPEAAPRRPDAHPGADRRLRSLGARFVPAHRARLADDRTRGKVALWGGAGKGALFLFLVDRERRLVDVAIDINPDKQGTHLPGAGHRVVGPAEAQALGVATVVVANGSYAAEIAAACRAAEWPVTSWTVGNP